MIEFGSLPSTDASTLVAGSIEAGAEVAGTLRASERTRMLTPMIIHSS